MQGNRILTRNRLKPDLEGTFVPSIDGPHGTWSVDAKTLSTAPRSVWTVGGWRGSALQIRFQSRESRCDCPGV